MCKDQNFLQKLTKRHWMMIAAVMLFLIFVIFNEQIMDTRIANAKMDALETILNDSPEEAKENIKTIIDTLLQPKK